MGSVLWPDVELDGESARGLSSAVILGNSFNYQSHQRAEIPDWFIYSIGDSCGCRLAAGSVHVHNSTLYAAAEMAAGQRPFGVDLRVGHHAGHEWRFHFFHPL